MVPDKNQQFVVDWIPNGTGSILVKSVAGSGKTSTLIFCAEPLHDEEVGVAAFNSKINKEFDAKIKKRFGQVPPTWTIKTVHGHGNSALWKVFGKRLELVEKEGTSKFYDYIADKIQNSDGVVGIPFALKGFVKELYNLGRQWAVGLEYRFDDLDFWHRLIEHFSLRDSLQESAEKYIQEENFDLDMLILDGIQWAVQSIKYGIRLACGELDKKCIIDFEDMIYIPLIKNFRLKQFRWMLIDEVQDINPSRRYYIKRALLPGGRCIFVGDPYQAIYGFTGADANSFENIKSEFNCISHALSISYRCSKAVVRCAQRYVPGIEAHENAPEGSELDINAEDLFTLEEKHKIPELNVNDAIICRNNKPLVELFFMLVKRGIPAYIEGKKIGEKIAKLVNRWKRVKTIDSLVKKLEAYKEEQVQKLMGAGLEFQAENIADTVEVILAVAAALPPGSSLFALKTKIESMFVDSEGKRVPAVTLSSSHKAKGLEWERVFWYGYNAFNPSRYARQQWQMDQERNLMYVTVTRAMRDIIKVAV